MLIVQKFQKLATIMTSRNSKSYFSIMTRLISSFNVWNHNFSLELDTIIIFVTQYCSPKLPKVPIIHKIQSKKALFILFWFFSYGLQWQFFYISRNIWFKNLQFCSFRLSLNIKTSRKMPIKLPYLEF